MRPEVTPTGTEVYECFKCGSRETAPDRRQCTDCEGELRHIGKSRDL